jgi:hypothetical protein
VPFLEINHFLSLYRPVIPSQGAAAHKGSNIELCANFRVLLLRAPHIVIFGMLGCHQ